MRLANKIALVTGGSSGIGRAIAVAFAAEGATVAITGRREDALQEVAREVEAQGGRALALCGDVTEPDMPGQWMRRIERDFGRLDILVNNAGAYLLGATCATHEADWQRLLDINVTAPWRLCRDALKALKTSRGNVLNIGSTAGLDPVPGVGAYVVSKAAIIMLSRQLALELADARVRVNCICPGIVETQIFETVMTSQDARDFLATTAPNLHPLGRAGQPEDIAAAALYLCSDEAAWVTGVVLPVAGGLGV